MAAAFSRIGTSGELLSFEQTLISAKVEAVAQQMLPIEQLVTVIDKAKRTGGITSVVQIGAQTLADLTESATLGMSEVSAAFASTARTLTQTTKGRDIFVTLLADVTGTDPSEADIVDTLAKATVKKLAGDVAAKYTEAGSGLNLLGAPGTPPTYADHFLPMFERIAVGQVSGRRNLLVPVLDISAWGAEPQFVEWQKSGQAWLQQDIDIQSGYLGIAPFGVRCWFTNDYTSSGGGNYGMMLAQSAIRLEFTLRPMVSRDNSEYGVGSSSKKVGLRTIYALNGARDTSTTNAGVAAYVS